MSRLKIKFHPLFFIYVFICIYFGWVNKIFYYIIVATIHEYGHYFTAKYLGYEMEGIIFSLSGAGLKSSCNFKDKHEILISIAGPLVNLFLIIFSICLWWIVPSTYLFTYDFVICNIVIMIFNLLPIYPLDGGRILIACLSLKNFNKSKLIKYNKRICIATSVIFACFYLISIFYKINVNLLIISIFMAINSISYDKNTYFDKVYSLNKKPSKKPLEVRFFRVIDMNRSNLIKYINPHYYSIFEYYENGKLIRIEEDDLYN